MELIYVEAHQSEAPVGIFVQQLSCHVEKAVAIIKISQRIMLVRVLHLANKIELAANDDVLEPQQQNTGLVRLADEIPGSQVKGLLLRSGVGFASHYNDRQ